MRCLKFPAIWLVLAKPRTAAQFHDFIDKTFIIVILFPMSEREPNTDTLANTLADQIRTDIEKQKIEEGVLFMIGDEVASQCGVSRGIAWGLPFSGSMPEDLHAFAQLR